VTTTTKARKFVESIAADRLKDMSPRMKRALKIIAEKLYTRNVHFILELIQNAEDNDYSPDANDHFIHFDIDTDVVTVTNNEIGFSRDDVAGICDVADSKKLKKAGDYIGEKGIGFKSVFVISKTPRIFSNGFCFQLSEPEFIVPQWIEPSANIDPYAGTTIVLPLKPDYVQGRKTLDPYDVIDEKIILFLTKLTRIEIDDHQRNRTARISKQDLGKGVVALGEGDNRSHWRVFTRAIRTLPHVVENDREGIEQRAVVLAFPVDKSGACKRDINHRLFAFLPTEVNPRLPFIVQSDFILGANREDLDRDREWNQWLRDEIAPTYAEAVRTGVQNSAVFARTWYETIPLVGDGPDAFFRPAATAIVNAIKREAVCLTQSRRLVTPDKVLRAPSAIRQLFPNDSLKELLGEDLEYLHEDSRASAEALDALGVRRLESDRNLWVKALSNETWLKEHQAEWFLRLYQLLNDHEFLIAPTFRNLRIILLENGELGCLSDGPIYFTAREERLTGC
jgi:hypothetical protein